MNDFVSPIKVSMSFMQLNKSYIRFTILAEHTRHYFSYTRL